MRAIPIINAIGCVVLTGFIFYQWNDGIAIQRKLEHSNKVAREEATGRIEAEKRNRRLEADIDGLKASIDSIREASDTAAASLAERTGQADALVANLAQTQEQLKTWEEAVKVRDAKITELNSNLIATRKRLDAAVEELKKAGAR